MKYRLPSGNYTNDVDRYIDTWRSLGSFIEKEFDFKLLSFDPCFSFSIGPYKSMEMMPSFAIKIFEKITKKEWAE